MTTVAVRSARTAAPKKTRTATVLSKFDNGTTLVEITERGPRSVSVSLYCVAPLASDYGKAFQWTGIAKKAGSNYAACLDGKASSCDCLGHLQHGRKTVCRHLACTRALLEAGKLS
jgi:hypothetical protein